MLNKVKLKQQVQIKYPLTSKEVGSLFDKTDNFHDADLNKIISFDEGYMILEIRRPHWVFLDATESPDCLTGIHFHLSQPTFDINWGTDDEIRRCMIYNFSISGNKFKLDTGDGGRSGTLECSNSTVELVTTTEIMGILNLP